MEKVVLKSRRDCEDFVRGLCFLGTGGGGRPDVGLSLILDQLERGREIGWMDIAALPEEAWTATVAGMGGRSGPAGITEELAALGITEEKHDALGRMVAAVRALEDSAGVKVEAIVPVEIGASNVPVPIATALELGVPVVDGDYAGGRAIPEVPQTIPEVSGVGVTPMSFVTRWGDVAILKDTVSTAMADRIGRHIVLAAHGGVGVSCYLLQVREARDLMAAGTLSQAFRVGTTIREARDSGADPVAAATRQVGGWLLFTGQITASPIAEGDSLAFGLGSHQLRGVGSFQGHSFEIWYKNEYHVSWLDTKPYATSPDGLMLVHLEDGEPAISYDFSVGDRVAVIGRRAHPAHRTPRGIELLGPRHFGFDLDYVPIEARVEQAND
jgi:DUF917 family protein